MSKEPAFVNHVGQCTADLERARRFYCEALDFEVERVFESPDGATGPLLGLEPPIGLTALYLRRGTFVLELLHFNRPNNPPAATRVFNEPGLTHLSFSVADMEATADRMVELGGSVVNRFPFAVMVRDPDGQVIELLPMSYRDGIAAELAAREQA